MATSANSWHIRAARPEEAAALTHIAHAAKRRWNYPEELLTLWRDALTVTAEFIQQSYTYVVEESSDLIGFVGLQPVDADVMELQHLWILPRCMGRKIGRALWERAILVTKQEGRTLLELDSDPNAAAFYEHMGAHRIGNSPSIPAGRLLPRMQKRLANHL
jgi:GNAT superfamily N-acetyltransferase